MESSRDAWTEGDGGGKDFFILPFIERLLGRKDMARGLTHL